MAERMARGFHALERKIHELEEEDRAARRRASRDEGEEKLVEIEEREKAAATVPSSHDE